MHHGSQIIDCCYLKKEDQFISLHREIQDPPPTLESSLLLNHSGSDDGSTVILYFPTNFPLTSSTYYAFLSGSGLLYLG